MTFNDKDVAGGTDAVLASMSLDANGDKIQVTQGGGCFTITGSGPGEHQRMCASDLNSQMRRGTIDLFPHAVDKFLQDLASGVMSNGIGIVSTQVGGQWYVSPARTFSQLALTVFSSISADDMSALLQLGSH